MAKILIISHRADFTVGAIERNLVSAGFEVVNSDPVIASISEKEKDADIVLMYAGGFIANSPDVLVYIRDIICTAENKPFCVIGVSGLMNEIEQIIPREMVTREFLNPLNMDELISCMRTYSESEKAVRRTNKHILLVDDDLMFLKMMQEWLSEKYQVTIVKSGAQAISYVANHKPDLIMLDYEMPITSGAQVMQMLRSEHSSADIPIIFLTGKSDKESVMDVMRLKPQGYLLKSMSRDQMTARVDEFFANLGF